MEFSKGKYQVLHLGRNNPRHQSRAGDQLAGKELSRKGLGVARGQQAQYQSAQAAAHAAANANSILSYIRKSICSRSRKVIVPLYSALVKLRLECCIQFWAHQCKTNIKLERVQGRATEMIKG